MVSTHGTTVLQTELNISLGAGDPRGGGSRTAETAQGQVESRKGIVFMAAVTHKLPIGGGHMVTPLHSLLQASF